MSSPLTDDLGYTPATRKRKPKSTPAPTPTASAPKFKPKVSVATKPLTDPMVYPGGRYAKAEDLLAEDAKQYLSRVSHIIYQMERLATTTREMTETLDQLRTVIEMAHTKLDDFTRQASAPPTTPYISVPTTLKSDPAPDWWTKIF